MEQKSRKLIRIEDVNQTSKPVQIADIQIQCKRKILFQTLGVWDYFWNGPLCQNNPGQDI